MKPLYTIVLIAAVLVANCCFAQIPYSIRIFDASNTQVPGELIGPGQSGNILITSMGQENVNCTDVTGATCMAKPGNFIFNTTEIKPINVLKKALFTSEHLSYAEIVFFKNSADQYVFYKIRLENVLVKHITDGYNNSTGAFTHQIELQAGRVGWTFYSASSTVFNKFGWDYTQNVQWTNF